MSRTDAIRRFYVEDNADKRNPHFAVVDRTGFLPPKMFYVGIAAGPKVSQDAIDLAEARNQCEARGEHRGIAPGTGMGKCQVCDATAKPDVVIPEDQLGRGAI